MQTTYRWYGFIGGRICTCILKIYAVDRVYEDEQTARISSGSHPRIFWYCLYMHISRPNFIVRISRARERWTSEKDLLGSSDANEKGRLDDIWEIILNDVKCRSSDGWSIVSYGFKVGHVFALAVERVQVPQHVPYVLTHAVSRVNVGNTGRPWQTCSKSDGLHQLRVRPGWYRDMCYLRARLLTPSQAFTWRPIVGNLCYRPKNLSIYVL